MIHIVHNCTDGSICEHRGTVLYIVADMGKEMYICVQRVHIGTFVQSGRYGHRVYIGTMDTYRYICVHICLN